MNDASALLWVAREENALKTHRPSLEAAGYRVLWARGVADASRILRRNPPDAVLVEPEGFRLPERRLVARLRRSARRIPLVVVTGVYTGASEVAGAIRSGADDCLLRPIAPQVLASRIEAAVRTFRMFSEATEADAHVLKTRDASMILDLKGCRCLIRTGSDYIPSPLSCREFELLAALLRRKNKVLAWRDLHKDGWRVRKLGPRSRTLVQHIMRLRQKLGDLGRRLQTISGWGYRWVD